MGEISLKKMIHLAMLAVCFILMGIFHADAAASGTVTVTVPGKRFYTVADAAVKEFNRKRTANGLDAFHVDGELMETAMKAAAEYQTGKGYSPEDGIACPYCAVRLVSYMEPNLYLESGTVVMDEASRIVAGCESLTEGWEGYDTIGIGCFAAKPGEFLNNNTGIVVLLGTGGTKQPYTSPGRTVACQEKVTVDPADFGLTVSGKISQTKDGAYDVMKKGESKALSPALESRRRFKQVNLEKVPYRTILSSAGASWSSTASPVVSVRADGTVKAMTCGVAVVTVSLGPWTASRKIVVADRIGSTSLGSAYPVFDSRSHIPAGYSGVCSVDETLYTIKNGKIVAGGKTSGPKVIKKDGLSYKVVSEKERTVQVKKPVTKTIPVAEIPATVMAGGKKYRVISIAAKAFQGCRNLKRVTIGKNIKTVGKKAFYGCTRLRNIVVQTQKLSGRTVGKKAFGNTGPKVKVKVPAKKLSLYRKLFYARGIGKKGKIKK